MATPPLVSVPAVAPYPAYKGETKEKLAAFNLYLTLGEKRSFEEVCKQMNKPYSTIKSWAKKFEWRLRVEAIQKEEAEKAKEEIKDGYFKNAENLRTYKYELLDILKKKVDSRAHCAMCEQNPATISEVIKVLEVVKTELGEPTSITKGQWSEDKGNPFDGVFSSFFKKKDAKPATTGN